MELGLHSPIRLHGAVLTNEAQIQLCILHLNFTGTEHNHAHHFKLFVHNHNLIQFQTIKPAELMRSRLNDAVLTAHVMGVD
jgi:hypothetical protein